MPQIFNNRPTTWQDLQNNTGQLFTEIGYHVEVSKIIKLTRGKKEIDVFVQDLNSEFKTTFLIECKFWNKPVKQETVHSFHTVMTAAGANFGFIVSKNGFQAGAYEAVINTNIYLVSLEELEDKFYEKWQVGMARKYIKIADELFPYWDPVGGKRPTGGPIAWETARILSDAYMPIVRLGPGDTEKFRQRSYPQILPVVDDSLAIKGTVTINNDRDYFDFIERNKEAALKHFKILYRET